MNDVDALDDRTATQILTEIKRRARSEAESDVRRITKERDEEERAVEAAEVRRDKEITNVKNRVAQDARRLAMVVNTIYAAGIVILELVPLSIDIVFGSSRLPVIGAVISLAAIVPSAWFAYRSFLESSYKKLFFRFRHLLQKRYLGDDVSVD